MNTSLKNAADYLSNPANRSIVGTVGAIVVGASCTAIALKVVTLGVAGKVIVCAAGGLLVGLEAKRSIDSGLLDNLATDLESTLSK